MTAFLQTDDGGWSYDIPEREDDGSPDLERLANRERNETHGRCLRVPTDRNGDIR
jgi:predicted NUDIX family NTP pyrophosphohydrolase